MAAREPGRLVVVRHGETAWSRLGRHTGRTDLPLTPLGEDQARAAAPALGDWTFELALTSPLRRARATAALLGHPDVEPDPDLAEWDYGPVEGLTREEVSRELGYPWTATVDGVRVGVGRSGLDPAAPVWGTISDEGESVEEVMARTARVIERVTPVLLGGGDVLLVAHGHLLRLFACTWLDLAPLVAEQLSLGTAAYSVLGFDRGRRALLHWNVEPTTTPPAPAP